MRTFWENERPSSSDDETENRNIETVKDLDLSKNELKSEIRKLEYNIKRYHTNLRNQEKINGQLRKKCSKEKTMKNKSQQEVIQLENELKSYKERYQSLTNCESL